jgi:RHS repeat-associated protein
MITTQTSMDGSSWASVRQWRLFHSMPAPGDGTNEKLFLWAVTQVAPSPLGATPPAAPPGLTPGTIFAGVALRNREDASPSAGVPYSNIIRVSAIADDLGERIDVAYTHNGCATRPSSWASNTTDCYPRWEYSGLYWGWGIYRRWKVGTITVRDMVTNPNAAAGNGVAPLVTYTYNYGAPGWRSDPTNWWNDPGTMNYSWGDFRGYASVITEKGSGATKTKTWVNYYRGMNGNKTSSGGTQTVTMSRAWTPAANADGAPATVYDEPWLQGQVWESYQWDTGWTFWSGTRSYSTWTTTQSGVTQRYSAMSPGVIRKWRVNLEQARLRDGTAASPVWRDTRIDTTFDSFGRQAVSMSTGFADLSGDESCSQTWYISAAAPPTSSSSPGWMNVVAQTAQWDRLGVPGGMCSATGAVPVKVARSFYNNNPHASGAQALDPMQQPLGAGFLPVATTAMTRMKNNTPGQDELDRWLVTHAAFDAAGRTTSVTDANGNTTTFGFNSTYGYPDRAWFPVAVNGNPLTVQTVLRPQDGQPDHTVDQNGYVTFYCYDSLSRLVAGFLPPADGSSLSNPCADLTSSSAPAPNMKFTYRLGAWGSWWASKQANIVVTSALQSGSTNADAVRIETAAYIDGLGRTRETQAWSPVTGKIIVTANLFDDRGNMVTAIDPFAIDDSAPGDDTSSTTGQAGFITWPNLPTTVTLRTTNTVYDDQDRPTSVTRKWGTSTLVTASTEYRGSRTINKPQIGSWAATTVDGFGRPIKTESYNGTSAPSSQGNIGNGGAITTYSYAYDTTINSATHDSYGYLTTTMTDDALNQTVVVADLSGRTVSSADPNAGTSTFVYDLAGNVTRTVDAVGNQVNTEYDAINRPTGRWAGNAADFVSATAADRLGSWTYDTAANGKGMPATETSWQGGLQYTSTVTGYDARFQATASKMTIPGTFGTDPLAGDWKYTTTYNQGGQPLTVTTPTAPVDPAVGGDPVWDVVTTHYDGFGQADMLWPGVNTTDPTVAPTTDRYVHNTVFDDLGRINFRTLALANSGSALRRSYSYKSDTGALERMRAGWTTIPDAPSSWFQNDYINRDAIGNVTSVHDQGLEPSGASSDVKECFLYDQHNRLIRAHTTTGTGSCATSTTSASTSTGTLDAYDLVWAFDDIHRFTSRTDKMTSVATTFGYSGSKHAVTSLSGGTTASYSYNAAGAMTSRAGATLTYDTVQRLTGYGSSEQYLYSVSNQRLIRTVGTTRTLYLPGMEVVEAAGTVTLTKWLTIGGATVGTKSMGVGGGGASVAWNCGSLQNSVVCQAPASAPNVYPARKRYKPYGDDRNTVTFPNTDHGFLNQPEDTSGLTYLNNRYYDPTIGNFTSVDPLIASTGTPYLYGGGNPTTADDPTGLESCAELGYPPPCLPPAAAATVEYSQTDRTGTMEIPVGSTYGQPVLTAIRSGYLAPLEFHLKGNHGRLMEAHGNLRQIGAGELSPGFVENLIEQVSGALSPVSADFADEYTIFYFEGEIRWTGGAFALLHDQHEEDSYWTFGGPGHDGDPDYIISDGQVATAGYFLVKTSSLTVEASLSPTKWGRPKESGNSETPDAKVSLGEVSNDEVLYFATSASRPTSNLYCAAEPAGTVFDTVARLTWVVAG